MALPVTISSSTFPNQAYFCGPFKSSGGNFYVVLLETTGNTPEVYKATDPTSSFTATDTANNPVAVPTAMWAHQSGDVLHIATADRTSDLIEYHTFSMATDLWVITDEKIEDLGKNPVGGFPDGNAVSVTVRGAGDPVVVTYTGQHDSDMGNDYNRQDYARRSSGGTWTVGINVDGQWNGNNIDYVAGVAVLGSSNRVHIAGCTGSSSFSHTVKTLNSSNTLSARLALVNISGDNHMTPAVSYDDGGTQRVELFVGLSGLVFHLEESGDGPPVVATDPTTNVLDTGHFTTSLNGSMVLCSALDGTTHHALWGSQAPATILYHDQAAAPQADADWGTDVAELTSVTINRISCNIYDRSGTKLAYVYLDGTTVKYNEASTAVIAGRTRLLLTGVGV